MKRTQILSFTACCLLAACGGVDDETTPLADELAQALELDDGGFTESDEPPVFGTLDFPDEAYVVALAWRADVAATVELDQGHLELIGVIGFDGQDDDVEPLGARSVQFNTQIYGHNDGILIRVVAPSNAELILTTDQQKQVRFKLAEIVGAAQIHEGRNGRRLGAMARHYDLGGQDLGE